MLRDLAQFLSFLFALKNRLRVAGSSLVVLGLLPGLAPSNVYSQTQSVVENQKPPAEFVPGQHELKGGQTNSYRILLKAGDFLSASVTQKQIDVSVVLYAPGGKKIAETDSPNDQWGSEPALLFAEEAGEFRVDILSPNSRAAAGSYEIERVSVRTATADDKKQAAIQRKFDEATTLGNERDAASRLRAIQLTKEVLEFYQSSKETYRQALALRAIGVLYLQVGDYRAALTNLDQSMTLVTALNDLRQQEVIETFLGGVHDVLGDQAKAIVHYERAIGLAKKSGNRGVEASSLNNIGKIHNDASDWDQARDYYLQALPVFRALGNQRTEGITLNNIGISYLLSGDPEKALDYLQEAVTLLRIVKDKNAEAYSLSNIGDSYRRLSNYQKALDFFQQAQTIQKDGNRSQEADTLDLMGVTYSEMGQPQTALTYHQQSLKIQQQVGNVRREGVSLRNLGHVYLLLNQPDQALENLDAAITIFRRIGDLNSAAIALQDSATAQLQKQNLEEARRNISESLSLVETVRARSGSPLLRASYLASRESAYEFYIDLLMQQDARNPGMGHDAEALQASERGRARSLLETLNESTVAIRKGVSSELVDREQSIRQLLNAKAQRLIQLTALKGSPQELETLNKEINSLEDDYQQVTSAIRKSSPTYAALTQPNPLGLKEIQDELDPDSLILEYSLGTDRSYLWVIGKSSLKAFQLPKRSDVEAVARELYQSLTARSFSKALETAEDRAARIAKADQRSRELIEQLSSMVLSPAAAELGTKRLIIVADGALQYVPFASLSTSIGSASARSGATPNYRPIILDHEVLNLPSASILAVQRRTLAGRPLAPKGVAVLADPVFSTTDTRLRTKEDSGRAQARSPIRTTAEDGDLRIIEHKSGAGGEMIIRRLPYTRQEADEILAVATGPQNLKAVDFQASRITAVSSELSNYRYLHFATHGYLDTARPNLSAIVLSLVDENGKPADGFLRALDIYNLKLPAELVVLSACETGLGKDIKGEGLEGLTQGFMYAGARRVVVSLWNVNDKATASLMGRLYSGMLRTHKTPAAALRAAQIEMLRARQWQSPYYWAAFVIQGDWK